MHGLTDCLRWDHLGIFAYLFACGVGFPGAEEIALLWGGLLVHSQVWTSGLPPLHAWGTAILVCLLGIFAGDTTLFWLGSRYGRRVRLLRPFRRLLRPARMRRVRAFFQRYGAKAIFIGRFLPGVRAATFFTAGWTGMPFLRFALWNGLAAILSVPIGVWVGYFFGENGKALLRRIDLTIGAVLLLAVVGWIVWRRWKAKRAGSPPASAGSPGAGAGGMPPSHPLAS